LRSLKISLLVTLSIFICGCEKSPSAQKQKTTLFPTSHNFSIGSITFNYQGAFRLRLGDFGESKIAHAPGAFTLNNQKDSFYIAGHSRHNGIAEFSIPMIVNSESIDDLGFAEPIQPFVNFLDKKLINPQNIDMITGMDVIEDELIVNAITYYDAPAKNTHTTFIIRSPNQLNTTKVNGFFELQGNAHASGWISKIPLAFVSKFEGTYIVGSSSGYPINARLSVGPTAFSTYLDELIGVNISIGLIPTTPLIDYSLNKKLNKDFYNKNGKNNVWTQMSSAAYGFIIPHSSSYLLLGKSGGHESGIGYKATQYNGNRCGGPCAYDPDDYYNHYWVYSTDDMLKVKNKLMMPNEIKPTKFDKLTLPFQKTKKFNAIIGADFNHETGLLYILLKDADVKQNIYEPAHLMLVYQVD